MNIELVGVLTIGQTLDRGFRLFRQTFWKIAGVLIIPVLFPVLLIPLFGEYLTLENVSEKISFGQELSLPIIIASMVLITLFKAWGYIVAVRYIHQFALGNPLPFRKIFGLSHISDLLFIFTYILLIPVLMISFLAFIIPAIYLLITYSVGSILIIIEKTYGFQAISKPIDLVWGKWWKTFLIFLVVIILFFIMVLIFSAPMMISTSLLPIFKEGAMQPTLTSPLYLFINDLSYIFFTPFTASVYIVHYLSLKAEKESSDIENILDSMDENPNS